MKKIFFTLVCAAFLTACGGSAIDRLESFIEDTEKECADFTNEEWVENAEEFDEILEDLEEEKDSYTDEDLQKMGKLTVRYAKIKMKQGGKAFKDMGNFLKGMSGE